eukprot:TRINITY_DN2669_c0_g4_i1.p1 TRINITY_DN2669_c0_g4~~TRINITY_DN2669_c0_g4_i1.p1  ORF type:complete len:109 (-),score=8.53 TRINITY_DN2669_c0_g4_i1:16-342(-)
MVNADDDGMAYGRTKRSCCFLSPYMLMVILCFSMFWNSVFVVCWACIVMWQRAGKGFLCFFLLGIDIGGKRRWLVDLVPILLYVSLFYLPAWLQCIYAFSPLSKVVVQ